MWTASLIFSALSSIIAWAALAIMVIICVFAISINDNRLDEMRFIEQTLQRNAEKIASLGRAAVDPEFNRSHPDMNQDYKKLLDEATHYTEKAHSLNYTRIYGSESERKKLTDPSMKSERGIADYFHAKSDTTNLMIIGMSACPIAVSATKLLAGSRMPNPTFFDMFLNLTTFDIALGMLTGLLTTFVVKSGSNVLSNTSIGAIDVSNPYGLAFAAAVAGLFVERFYSWLEPVVKAAKQIS
jgi:hypothetical protein